MSPLRIPSAMIVGMREDRRALGYDAVAEEYVRRYLHELDHKPFDRMVLDRFAASVRSGGTVVDIGCGPGQIGRYLADRGLRVGGLDLSERSVACGRRLNPGMDFLCADMQALPIKNSAWSGIVAFYSVIHIPSDRVGDTLLEFARVLEPEAPLLVAFHIGDETVHLDEWWERRVSLDFHFFRPTDIRRGLQVAGFNVEEVLERDPYSEDVEYQSRRCYIFARKSSVPTDGPDPAKE